MRTSGSEPAAGRIEDCPDGPAAWLNGRFTPSDAAAVPVTDLGLQGIAVTEMVRTYDHELFRLQPHLARLEQSLRQIDIAADTSGLHDVCKQLARRNTSFLESQSDLGLVVFVTAGGNPTYLGAATDPTVCVHTFELPLWRWARLAQDGVSLVVSTVPQPAAELLPLTAKTRSRLHWHLAGLEAKRRDPNAQPILLSAAGCMTETPTSNVFAVFEDRIVTPARDILPGITRGLVRELSESLGLRFEEADLVPGDIATADEMFLSSTPFGLLPVTRFEQQPVGNGRPGPIFFELCNALSELAGIDVLDQLLAAASERQL